MVYLYRGFNLTWGLTHLYSAWVDVHSFLFDLFRAGYFLVQASSPRTGCTECPYRATSSPLTTTPLLLPTVICRAWEPIPYRLTQCIMVVRAQIPSVTVDKPLTILKRLAMSHTTHLRNTTANQNSTSRSISKGGEALRLSFRWVAVLPRQGLLLQI